MEKQQAMNNPHPMGDWIMLSTMTLFIYFLGLAFPPFVFMLPLPTLLLYLRRGYVYSLSSLLVTLVTIGVLGGGLTIFQVLILGVGSVVAIIIAEMVEKKFAITRLSAVLIVVPLILTPLFIVTYNIVNTTTVEDSITGYYGELETSVAQMQEQLGSGEREKSNMETMLKNLEWVLLNMYPMLFGISIILAALISLSLAKKYGDMLFNTKFSPVKFNKYEYPESAIFIFVFAAVGFLLLEGFGAFVSNNLLGFSLFLYFLMGLSLMSYLFETFHVTRGARFFIYLAIFLFPILPVVITGVGLLNVRIPLREKIMDFKKSMENDNEI